MGTRAGVVGWRKSPRLAAAGKREREVDATTGVGRSLNAVAACVVRSATALFAYPVLMWECLG